MFKKYFLLLACVLAIGAASNFTTYTYKTVGDVQIKLDVYTPPRPAPAGGYPVIFSIHGGAFIEGNKHHAFTSQELSEMMSRGWVAVTIDYRLLPAVLLQEIVEDVQDAYKWVHTELGKFTPINLNLISVFGGSAGGSLAVLSGYKLSPRPQAIVAFYPGVANWTEPWLYNPNTPVNPSLVASANLLSVPVLTEYSPLRTADPRVALWHTSQHQGKAGWLAVTHDPNMPTDKVMALLRDLSATENVDKNYPPTYLAHGTADNIVPYNQSVQMANSLKLHNIPYVLDLVPNVGHTFDTSPELWQQHVLPAFDFVQKYMQTSTKTSMKFLEK